MKHAVQYKESCVISEISNLADNSSKLWKPEKEQPEENILQFFLLDTLKTRRLFSILKRSGEASPLSTTCVPVTVAEYA